MSAGGARRNTSVLGLALPIILSNLSIPPMGAVDTAVMGHLPDAAHLGGVALGALVFTHVYWGFGFLRMATTGFAAQAKGAGDHRQLRQVTLRGALLALGLGALVVALQLPLAELAVLVLEGSPRVKALARDYVLVRTWGAPAALFVYVSLGWLIGMQRMRTVLALTVLQNAINAALAILFVAAFGWGIEGVAAATLLADYAGAALGALALWHAHRGIGGRWGGAGLFDRAKLLAAFRVNGDIFLRTLFLVSGFAWFTSQGAGQGDGVLAANAILVTFIALASYGLDGFAHAAETLVGAAVGARDRAAFRAAVRVSTLWAAGVALLAAGYALMPSFGNHGLWAALLAFAACRGLTLAIWYPRLLRGFAA